MKPYLYNLKARFTEYRIENVLTLKSKYAFRLYEWLKSFHTNETTCYISKIKELFSTKYKESYDIIRFCLEPAIEEINLKTDLSVSYTKKFSGRIVSAIIFTVHEKKELPSENTAINELEKDTTTFALTHIKPDGTPENFTIEGKDELQRLIDTNGFEKGRTFISKTVDGVSQNATEEFNLK
jgi:plasmid replication initiation protein